MLVEGQIRAHLKALIEPVSGMRGHVVFDQYEIPDETDGHWVVVSTGDELIQNLTLGHPTTGAKQQHTCEVNIDVMRFQRPLIFDEAELILERLVPVVFADPKFGGLVKSFRALGKRRDKSLEGAPVARLRLQCETVYHTYDRDPSTSV